MFAFFYDGRKMSERNFKTRFGWNKDNGMMGKGDMWWGWRNRYDTGD